MCYCILLQNSRLDRLLDLTVATCTCRSGTVEYMDAMNVHAVARGIQGHSSGAFDLTLHGAGARPVKTRDNESGEEDAPDVHRQVHVKVPKRVVSS